MSRTRVGATITIKNGRCAVAPAVNMADSLVVRDYVDDLRGLLERSSIIEQRGFLKPFVDRIEVGDSELKMYYTIPMPPQCRLRGDGRTCTFRTPRFNEREGVRE